MWPRRIPSALSLGKAVHSSYKHLLSLPIREVDINRLTRRAIQPRLVTNAIREPSIGTTDGNVHDQIEWLIEGSDVLRTIDPRVGSDDEGVVVSDGRWELPTLEEGLVELHLE